MLYQNRLDKPSSLINQIGSNSLCTNNQNINRLVSIRNLICSHALGNFIDNVLGDVNIIKLFIESPASVSHHHSESGGLLSHSLEVAEFVANFPYINNDEREITIVAALFHDIGKVRIYNSEGYLNKIGKLVSHDALTLEVCATALHQLDIEWPDAAFTLRHIWTCASPGSRYGFQPNTPLAGILRFADKHSVDCFMHSKAFQQYKLNNGFVNKDDKYYWRPKTENETIRRRKVCRF